MSATAPGRELASFGESFTEQDPKHLARVLTGGERPAVEQWIARAARRLQRAHLFFGHGTANAREEASWLLAGACGLPPSQLPALAGRRLRASDVRRADNLVAARITSRKPTAYLLGEAWLQGLRFHVDERVIVPRSFIAELLDVQLQPWADPRKIKKVLDMCTGSGCLAILAAKAFPRCHVDAVDLSSDALSVAATNVRRHRVTRRVRLLQSDLFKQLPQNAKGYDLIIANPPYVDTEAMRALPMEYRCEPALALAGGEDGLALVRKIIRNAPDFLSSEGLLVVEIGHNRDALERAYPRTPFTWLETGGGDQFVFLLTREQALETRRRKPRR